MKIAVTGGCGYLGSVLLPRLNEYADAVDVYDIKPPSAELVATLKNGPACKFFNEDIAEGGEFKKRAASYDTVIHLAALVGYPACQKDPELAVRNNVRSTENILKFKQPDCRVLLSSTISNYGAQTALVDENTETRPNSLYGETKKLAEELVLADPNNIVFRFAGAFGYSPTMRHDNLIHDFVSKAVKGETISVYESHFIRQFIHVQDMIGAILFAIDNWDRMAGQIFNVGNPNVEITKKDLIEEIAKLYRLDYRFENSGTDLEKRNYPISFQKLLRLGFKPRLQLKDGIPELISFYESEGHAKRAA